MKKQHEKNNILIKTERGAWDYNLIKHQCTKFNKMKVIIPLETIQRHVATMHQKQKWQLCREIAARGTRPNGFQVLMCEHHP